MSDPSVRSRSESTEGTPPPHEAGEQGGHRPPRKRQRVRLSCLECRRRKLSCDREFPCSRCLQSGTPERCEFETRPGLAPPNKLGLSQAALAGFDSRLSLPITGRDSSPYYRKDSRDADRIRRLELEVAHLKSIIPKQASLDDGSTAIDRTPPDPKNGADADVGQSPADLPYQDLCLEKSEMRFVRGKEWKSRYLGPHSAYLAFQELTGLSPFMKETSAEWLRPLHVHHSISQSNHYKDRQRDAQVREKKFLEPDLALERHLPSKQETDSLVSIYLDQFEQIHRIVHIPSFRRDYAGFWDPMKPRSAAFTALVLAMMGVSSCLDEHLPQRFERLVSSSHMRAVKWIEAVSEWQDRQSQKHRRMIHYQIALVLYLGKRVNTVKKKRYWKGAGALSQDAVSVGLHREPGHVTRGLSPFDQEMRRRIWATIQSFDLQASFDHGLPTLMSSLYSDIYPPRNIDDSEFDEDSEELPPSKPPGEYTFSSYQHLSRRCLALRLELSRFLTGPNEHMDYDSVIRLTNEITQEIDMLPSWDVSGSDSAREGVPKKPLLAYTLLHIQLRQYIIPLHQPFLKLRKNNSKYLYSEIVYYNAARDMVLLDDKLAQLGIRTLNFMREDNLTLAINLCSVTMLQPRGSTNMIMINSQHTLELMEKCLAMKEDRILRCGNNEPWSYSIMCAALGLLQAHLGIKTPEKAKAASADRFVNLNYKLLAGQEPPVLSESVNEPGVLVPPPQSSAEVLDRSKSATPFQFLGQVPPPSSGGSVPAAVEVPGTPWWFPNPFDPSVAPQMQPNLIFNNPDFNLEAMGLNFDALWGGNDWEWEQA
ncbi:hypothetical protein B0T24DRAFT_323638 [Lasiosphaeria ovina]|uniref:Zn(2)-C6 fungal-type domain-containing protein n=1 Tax=Lasiosphaeria ovina TaxID=92902 RepID=A0AAE0N5J8_9PEZI|nr:hypothetical protein B0T24DRAFT_323638 [Lasiosphaeria ovina]